MADGSVSNDKTGGAAFPRLPLLIIQNGTMSKEDITRLRANGLCVVENKNPQSIRFLDPPRSNNWTLEEEAAIQLARVLLREGKIGGYNLRGSVGAMYADILLAGDPLKRGPHTDAMLAKRAT